MRNKTKLMSLIVIVLLSSIFLGMSNKPERKTVISTRQKVAGEELKLEIEEGEYWLHELKVIPWLPIIKVKNPPQIAVWIEDEAGNHLKTLYVTKRTAKQEWRKAPGDSTPKEEIRRKASLPHWAHQRGVQYADGLYLPTKSNPLADVITSATPEGSFELATKLGSEVKKFIIKAEVNNSADFNKYYPKDAKLGAKNYSGGEWGSGQPAVVYAAKVDLTTEQKIYQLKLIGHSSPDGSSGELVRDLSKLTTARGIVDKIKLFKSE